VWLTNRNPQMQVILTPNSVAGQLHDIEVCLRMKWDAPLFKGQPLEVQLDFLQTWQVTTL
jgi:hypothetical protein